MKRGGNGVVTFSGNVATKTLKRNSNKERIRRFSIEVRALQDAREAGVPNVVELLDEELDGDPPRFRMRKYAGDVDDLLPLTRNRPCVIARLVLPLVVALRHLATLPVPIYHRDLKPSNILYDGPPTDPTLVLADFGCAFLRDSAADRITGDLRAVGATFFRAPEYTHGRVEDVDTAGDVFSVGKLLWYLCNGVRDEVFPYTLWFPNDYNLAQRCDAAGVSAMNLIIGGCVEHDRKKRMTYETIIQSLQRISSDHVPIGDESERLRVLTHEGHVQLRQEELTERTIQFITALHEDLVWVSDQIERIYAGTTLAKTAKNMAAMEQSARFMADRMVTQHVDAGIANWNTTYARISIRGFPPSWAPKNEISNSEGPFFSIQTAVYTQHGEQNDSVHIYHVLGLGQMLKQEGVLPLPYSRAALLDFFRSTIARIGV